MITRGLWFFMLFCFFISNPSFANRGANVLKYYLNDVNNFNNYLILTDSIVPVITLNNLKLCPDTIGKLTASAEGAAKYKWSTGSTGSSIIVPSKDSSYTVTVTDSSGNVAWKSAMVRILPKPTNFLQDEITLCNNTSIAIRSNQTFNSYRWQDGSVTQSIFIKNPGTYSLTVTDSLGCKGEDYIIVKNECPPIIYVPGAFTPGELTINNIFYAHGSNITKYQIDIFNRWGTLVFHSDNLEIGWDGKYNSNYCPIGVYMYIIHYEGQVDGAIQKLIKKGAITLLR